MFFSKEGANTTLLRTANTNFRRANCFWLLAKSISSRKADKNQFYSLS